MTRISDLLKMTDEELTKEKDREYLWEKGVCATILTSEIACRSTDVILGVMTKEEAYDSIMTAYHKYLDDLTDEQKRLDKKYEMVKHSTLNTRI